MLAGIKGDAKSAFKSLLASHNRRTTVELDADCRANTSANQQTEASERGLASRQKKQLSSKDKENSTVKTKGKSVAVSAKHATKTRLKTAAGKAEAKKIFHKVAAKAAKGVLAKSKTSGTKSKGVGELKKKTVVKVKENIKAANKREKTEADPAEKPEISKIVYPELETPAWADAFLARWGFLASAEPDPKILPPAKITPATGMKPMLKHAFAKPPAVKKTKSMIHLT